MNIIQLRVALVDSHPPIWRRVQIMDNSTFFDLHNVIQEAMGWEDYHLHNFAFQKNRADRSIVIGPIDEEDMYEKVDESKTLVKDWLGKDYKQCRYSYDYGDDWDHNILFEKTLPSESGLKYPRCIAGKMACPPEDSGGLWGYYGKLEALQDPKHPDHNDVLDWMGEDFDPEVFDPSKVKFR